MIRLIGHVLAVFCLTLLTQIGGLVWLLALALRRFLPWRRRSAFLLLFVGLYAAATVATWHLAPLAGRVALACYPGSDANLTVGSPILCALNRTYVTPDLAEVAQAYADHMAQKFPGTKTLALDANFPFVTGFPLMPHLSHDDGRKLDLAFYYQDAEGKFRNGETRSPLGYFAFEQPEAVSPLLCAKSRWLSLRWDLAWLQPIFPDWRPEPARMREALRWLSSDGRALGIERIFVEPHIAGRYGAGGGIVRFQGCRAARHDDHIHIQVR
ncbi:hypothetical protein [Rhizobium sp.]